MSSIRRRELLERMKLNNQVFEEKKNDWESTSLKILKYWAIATKNVIKVAGPKTGAKTAGKLGTKTVAKAVPVVSLAVGGFFAVQRFCKGDYGGATAELASGAAGCFPGAGTAVSMAIDGGLLIKDVRDEKEKIQGEANPRDDDNAVYIIVCHGEAISAAFWPPEYMSIWFIGEQDQPYNVRGELYSDMGKLMEKKPVTFSSMYSCGQCCYNYKLWLPMAEGDILRRNLPTDHAGLFFGCPFNVAGRPCPLRADGKNCNHLLAGVHKIWPIYEFIDDLSVMLFDGTSLGKMANWIRGREPNDVPINLLCFFCRNPPAPQTQSSWLSWLTGK